MELFDRTDKAIYIFRTNTHGYTTYGNEDMKSTTRIWFWWVVLSPVVRSVIRNEEYNSDIANICYNNKQQPWHQLVRNLEQ